MRYSQDADNWCVVPVKKVLVLRFHPVVMEQIIAAEAIRHFCDVRGTSTNERARAHVTQNVVEALARDSDRRSKATGDRIPRPFRRMFNVFLGVEGTRMPVHLRSREMIYLSYCLQKPGTAGEVERNLQLETAAAL